MVFVLGVLLPCGGSSSAELIGQVRLERLPAGARQPQALVDGSQTVHLVYLQGEPKACDVLYAKRDRGQTGFSVPLRVNSMPGSAIAIGTVRGAQLALGRNGRVHVAWNGSEKASSSPTGGAPMLYSRLNKSGDGFEPQRNLMTSTTHLDGGGSVAADAEGRVYVVWHGHRVTGPQEEQDRGVFIALSADDGRTFAPERQVNPRETGACGCCGLKAFADTGGRLEIVYRSARAEVNRDIILLVSTNHGASFESRTLGPWRISTCPMSTQALGSAVDGALLALYETQGQIFRAAFRPERLAAVISSISANGSTGNRKHPAFAVDSQGRQLLIAWTEGTGWEKGGELAWECIDLRTGNRENGRAPGVPVWSFAAAVLEPDGSFALIY